MSAMDFYEQVADTYDEMTRFDGAAPTGARNARRLGFSRYGSLGRDAACGTGSRHPAFGPRRQQPGRRRLGGHAREARGHASRLGAEVTWVEASMEALTQHVEGGHDALFCLGNSVPHLLTPDALQAGARELRRRAPPAALPSSSSSIMTGSWKGRTASWASTRHGSREFVRFYDFEPGLVRFNILTVTWDGEKASHRLAATTLYPYGSGARVRARGRGLRGTKALRRHAHCPYDRSTSPNLVLVATKR